MSNLETGLVLRLEASLAKFEKQMSKARQVGTKYATDTEARFSKAHKAMAQTAEQSAQVIGREMDRLREKYDPVFRASKQYETAVNELNRAQKVGALTSSQYDSALAELTAEYQRSAGAANLMNNASGGIIKSSRGMSAGIQNAAYQIGDFAVQVGGGTSATRALGQQLPQLLGGMGMWGAVIGAVAAGLVPLIGYMVGTKEEAKKLSDVLKELDSAVSDFNQAVQDSITPMAELVTKYGTMAKAMRKTLDAIADTSRIKAMQSLSEAAKAASAAIGSTANITDSEGNFLRASDAVMALNKQFGVTVSEAAKIAGAMDRLDIAKGPENIATAAEDLRSKLEEAFGVYASMPEEIQKQYDALLEVEKQAGALKGSLVEASNASGGLSKLLGEAVDMVNQLAGTEPGQSWLDAAILKAGTLASALWDAVKANASIAQKATNAEMKFTQYQYSQYGQGRVAGEKLIHDTNPLNGGTGSVFPVKHKKSGGRSKKKPLPSLLATSELDLKNLERQISLLGKTSSETATLQAKWKLLDEAKKRGIDLNARLAGSGETVREQIDRQSQAIGDLTAQYENAQERAKFFDQAQTELKGGIIDAIVEGKNLSGVLSDLAKSLAKAALQAALFNEGPLSGGSGGGLLGGLFSAISGAFGGGSVPMMPKGGYSIAPSFDGGGFTGTGARSGGVDGKGGFSAILHPNETVIDHTKGQGIAGAPQISISIDARGAQSGVGAEVQAAIKRATPQIVSQAVQATKSAAKRGY